ncbi:hypothetical protein SUDANB108_03099 [Streptomyces sp. enrichment culture]|uniref:DUF397 domain-containing protein n=1 Tax=Streptomyces sp. enrichment culture TaxID=1795815 RepID=UPI003F5626D4
MTPTPPRWFKSSYSGNDDADCLEAAISPTPQLTLHVRDSKHRDGAHLAFSRAAWSEFLAFTAGR